MEAARWRRLDELFNRALDLTEAERQTFLDRHFSDPQCADDPELRREVEAMLAADGGSPLADGPLGGMATDEPASPSDDLLANIVRSGIDVAAIDESPHDLDTTQDRPSELGNSGSLSWRRTIEPLPFESLGPYRLVSELGRGGLATVYLARRDDAQFTMEVAVKLVRRGFDTPDLLERLRLERQILARLEHPNIARLIDGGTAPDGRPYFVMERIEGERIDHWCARHGLDLRQRIELFRKVCDAVQTAHRRLVLHRDVKPSNILVTDGGVPKLLDFGIAKLLDTNEGEEDSTLARSFSTLTDTGMKLLTPEFASPEQVRGETLTTASDVYSLGVLLYLLITGEPPYTFDRRRPSEVERVVCEVEPPRPSARVWGRRRAAPDGKIDQPTRWSLGWPRRAAGDDLDTIVHEALRKEPERRYGSVARLSSDLAAYLDDLPISARPDTLGYRAGKFVRRHRGPVVAAVLLLWVLLGGVVTTSWQAREARRAQQRAEQQRELADEQREQAERERRRAEEATTFLVDLFDFSDPFRTEGEKQETTARQLLDRGARRIEDQLGDDPLLQATLMTTIGRVYRNLSLLDESETLLTAAHGLRRNALGDGDGEVLDSLQALANLRIDQERFQEAEEILRRVVDGRRQRGQGPALAVALEELAVAVRALDRPEVASDLLEEALAIHGEGDDVLAVARVHNALAQICRQQHDYAAAETWFRDVLEVRRHELGDDHPLVAQTLNDLALTLQNAGRLDQAEEHFREVLTSYRKNFGERHHHVVSALGNLAGVLLFQGKAGEALALHDQSEALVLELYGADHPAMARIYHARAMAHRVDRDPAAAIPWIRRAWAIHRQHFGVEHTSALRDAAQLAELLVLTKDPGAEEFLSQLIADLRRIAGSEDPRLAYPLFRLGVLRLGQADPARALPVLEEVVEIRRQVFPEGHWETAQAEAQLGRCLTHLGRLDEAETLLTKSETTLRAQYDDDHPQVRAVVGYLEDLETARRVGPGAGGD